MTTKRRRKQLLVPVDFSAHSTAAVLKACELADCLGAGIALLHVVHDPAEMPGYYARLAKRKQLTRMEDTAREMLDDYLAGLRKQYPKLKPLARATALLVLGLPVTRILEVADKLDAGMVVLGSQGHTGLKRVMLGSKAEQVVHLCQRPVLVVKSQVPTQ